MDEVDAGFYERADSHIQLSNDQLRGEPSRGKVNASMMYATARFNAYVSAWGAASAEQMAADREKIITYFLEQYRFMLEEHVDDHISNFSTYIKVGSQ
ncbi:MAG TPA: DUF3144 domain-containing protein [Gammaproteobacteria bacterium]|jgi:hypothetical protein|nr:DUF3144 domain-containing protein [Gammaproteobacteria bacterium]